MIGESTSCTRANRTRAAVRYLTHKTALLLVMPGLLALTVGCPTAGTNSEPVGSTGVPVNLDRPGNNAFASATALPIAADDVLAFTGSIEAAADVDVYEIPELKAGDRLRVDVTRTSGNLDAVLTIFDQNFNLHAYNDDRDLQSNSLDPLLDITIRGDDGPYFVAIAAFPGGSSTGNYEVNVQTFIGTDAPPEDQLIVFLNYAGGRVESQNFGNLDLPPFTARSVGLDNVSTTNLTAAVTEYVSIAFAQYNVLILTSDNSSRPSAGVSIIHFGGVNPRAFGLAEVIDVHDLIEDDQGLIFPGSFDGNFSGQPTFNQMVRALGNTAVHEIGHLVGLVHTEDCQGFMDATCPNDNLLFPQSFERSPLDPATFPIGFQDSADTLDFLFGTNPALQ